MDKTYIDKLAWIYLKDGELLVTLTRGKDTWYTPGGKREPGEGDNKLAQRSGGGIKRRVIRMSRDMGPSLAPGAQNQLGSSKVQAIFKKYARIC